MPQLVKGMKYGFKHLRDYAEIPSRMLEHFIWILGVWISLGEHYSYYASGGLNEPPRDISHSGSGLQLSLAIAEGIAKTQFNNRRLGCRI